VGRFWKRGSGDLFENEDGFSVELAVSGYPGVTFRYKEGPRTMDVAGEAMAEGVDFVLYRSSMAGWEPPNASETVDNATRQTVLDRIIAALSYGGYVIEPGGDFPGVRNQLEGRIQLEQLLAAARRKRREEDELRRKWRNDTLEQHRHRDSPK
jgi:Immunity protein 74